MDVCWTTEGREWCNGAGRDTEISQGGEWVVGDGGGGSSTRSG